MRFGMDEMPLFMRLATTRRKFCQDCTKYNNLLRKLFIYLALAKPAFPGQFDLLVSSQSKENASKYFCLFRWAAPNKSDDFWAAQKYFIIPEQNQFVIICFFHCPKLADSGLQKLNSRAAQNAWFSEGVVRFLSFLCQSSPSFDPTMDIPEQHEIKTSFMSSTKLNTWKHFDDNNNLCSIAACKPKTCFSTLYLRSIIGLSLFCAVHEWYYCCIMCCWQRISNYNFLTVDDY